MSPEAAVVSAVGDEQVIRYWGEFDFPDGDEPPIGTRRGIGVTTLDGDDALGLVAAGVFAGNEMPPVRHVRENVDVSTLDEKHVMPNMAPANRRGVWFPLGYD